jgi:hypothetical protein
MRLQIEGTIAVAVCSFKQWMDHARLESVASEQLSSLQAFDMLQTLTVEDEECLKELLLAVCLKKAELGPNSVLYVPPGYVMLEATRNKSKLNYGLSKKLALSDKRASELLKCFVDTARDVLKPSLVDGLEFVIEQLQKLT